MEFTFKIEESTEKTTIHVAGNLIEKNQALDLMERVDEIVSKGPTAVIIEMGNFKYMNSTGLNVLIQVLTKARKSGGDAVLCCVPENIRSLMLITKLTNIFTIVNDETEAVKALAKTV